MKINLGNFSLFDGLISFTNVSVDMDFAELLEAMLNKALPKAVRKQAYEQAYDKYQTSEPGSPEYEAVIDLCKSGTWFETEKELESCPVRTTLDTEESLDYCTELDVSSEFSEEIWEQYKATVIIPLLTKYESDTNDIGKKKTKATLKAESKTLADLRKCAAIKLGKVFDKNTLELVYKARVKLYGKEPKTNCVVFDNSELQSETNCNTPGAVDLDNNLEDSPVVSPTKDNGIIYVLRENAHLVEGKEPSSYTVVESVLDIPHNTCQYLDENGELGEAVYAMAQARKEARDGKIAFKKATEAENVAQLQAKLADIEANPNYSSEERQNRIRNAKAMYSITDFSKV
jgi:hypothetical protein